MSDIASATRNFNDYQLIMSILWKRLNDTGKDWRHVYKSLTVLEFLVAQGAERVIDELREHQYQIQVRNTLQAYYCFRRGW
jgi:epsin